MLRLGLFGNGLLGSGCFARPFSGDMKVGAEFLHADLELLVLQKARDILSGRLIVYEDGDQSRVFSFQGLLGL
jgi:hypothetical protein